MTMLPIKRSSRIIVVAPGTDRPRIYERSESIPCRIIRINMMIPSHVTICIGSVVNEVMLKTAYRISDFVDHLELPASRSCTSKGTAIVRKPTHEESARKNACFSFMFKSAFTTFLSRSLKSEALDMSIPVAELMIL